MKALQPPSVRPAKLTRQMLFLASSHTSTIPINNLSLAQKCSHSRCHTQFEGMSMLLVQRTRTAHQIFHSLIFLIFQTGAIKMIKKTIAGLALIISTGIVTTANAAAIDTDAAMSLAKKNGCLTCHAVDKTKMGPAFKQVAAKYKGDSDAQAKLVKHLTTGPMVKMQGGMEMQHKIIDTKDQAEIKNLADWILSL
jgi:cytochrome c